MRLYTSKVIADWLGLTERRVRQLRDEGIIEEQAPGLYDLRATTRRYISYLRSGSLADERAGLTRAKREAAEMENALRRGELHRTEEIESGIKTMLLNIRGRFLSLPAKLSPALAAMGGTENNKVLPVWWSGQAVARDAGTPWEHSFRKLIYGDK